jgi:hypothetical protein
MEEFRKVVEGAYIEVLERPADPDGLHNYSMKMKSSGLTKNKLLQVLRSSKEFKRKQKVFSDANTQTDALCTVYAFGLIRDNEDTIEKTFLNLKLIESREHSDFEYFISENDSKDRTPQIMKQFFDCSKGLFSTESLNKKKWGDVTCAARTHDMANYRNMNKQLCDFTSFSNYSILFDTEISFTHKTYIDMKNVLDKHKGIAMVTPYSTVKGKSTYYDTFALLTVENNQKISRTMLKEDLIDVKSAFGGFVLIRTDVLKQCSWAHDDTMKNCAEHISFCKEVSKFGRIVIAKNINVEWGK